MDVDPDGLVVHPEGRGVCDIGGRAGDSRVDAVDQGGRLAARPAKRLHRGLGRVADPQGAFPLVHGEDDRRALDLDDLPDQRGEIGDGPALLAGEHAEERRLLLWARPLVDVKVSPPVALQRVTRNEYVDHNCQPGNVEPVDRAAVEMIGKGGLTRSVVRLLADPARAKHIAIANLEDAPLQLVLHDLLPVRRRVYYGPPLSSRGN